MGSTFENSDVAPLRPHVDGVTIEVLVVPNASRNQLVGLHGTRLRVRVSAPAEAGKANRAVAELLRSAFGVRVDLLSGPRSRTKRFLLRDLEFEKAISRMKRISR